MTLEVRCQCGKRFMAKPHLAGKRVACPSCGSTITIPARQPPTTPAPVTVVACQCGQRFSVKPNVAGKKVRCTVCQQPIQVPDRFDASLAPQVASLQPQQANDELWDDLPTLAAAASSSPTDATLTATRTSVANQLMANARAEQLERKKNLDSWGTGQIISGVAMTLGATIWFGTGLLVGRIFFYPPIMFVAGAIALINGIAQKLNR